MLFRRSKPAAETTQLLQGLGLTARDVSESALAVLARLTAELAELKAKLSEAEELADRDALAPVFNRRAFLRELHRTMSEVERYKTPAAVIYIDLDGFKSVNDEYGHSAGDAVLRHVGLLLADSVRESDVVGRLGGDEFGIILNRATRGRGLGEGAIAKRQDQCERHHLRWRSASHSRVGWRSPDRDGRGSGDRARAR